MRACAEFVGYVIITLMQANTIFTIALSLILAGCATAPKDSTLIDEESTTPNPEKSQPSNTEPQRPYADIPSAQLNQLLEAEFAIRARDLKRGLENLRAASLEVPDPAIARRALQLAQFLRDTDVILEMAQRVSNLAVHIQCSWSM